ncbi:hypothetical protein Q0F99_08950 [Rathayibacter oskolensis]|uniref:hypothetical protein n=1 Tax=Rathayibacter oskolensis TaxID=1891671 RepID=UPI00265E7682|nr:hypothetical protein [Rathayibacter oskolensis]WKK72971.1 hypothetical protein Q0F99_08950 [Rathayibacter oskolensis]
MVGAGRAVGRRGGGGELGAGGVARGLLLVLRLGREGAHQAAGDEAGRGGDQDERTRAAAGERLHVLQQLGGLAVLEPGGDALSAAGEVRDEVRGHVVLTALSVRERGEVVAEGAGALGGVVLLGVGLLGELAAALVEEVLDLGLGLLSDVRRLLLAGGDDVARGLLGIAGDGGGLLLGSARLLLRGVDGARRAGARRDGARRGVSSGGGVGGRVGRGEVRSAVSEGGEAGSMVDIVVPFQDRVGGGCMPAWPVCEAPETVQRP